MDFISERTGSDDSPVTLRDWLAAAPFALTLSSGFFGFFAHAGVLAALEQAGLAPARLSGSSAGALVAGFYAAGLSAAEITFELGRLERADFWDPGLGLGYLRGKKLRARLEALLPVRTFEDCPRTLAVSAYDPLRRRSCVLDAGPLAPAIAASCAVPLLFQPVWIDSRSLLDGGVADRPGLLGMPHGQRVLYHHLVSRSPWRRRSSPALALPQRIGLTALCIRGLPRLGPFQLARGSAVLALAQSAATRALDRPITRRDGTATVDVGAGIG